MAWAPTSTIKADRLSLPKQRNPKISSKLVNRDGWPLEMWLNRGFCKNPSVCDSKLYRAGNSYEEIFVPAAPFFCLRTYKGSNKLFKWSLSLNFNGKLNSVLLSSFLAPSEYWNQHLKEAKGAIALIESIDFTKWSVDMPLLQTIEQDWNSGR